MYVDESGDIGAYNKAAGQTGCSYYALAGIILPMDKWQENLIGMVKLRRELKQIFGFPQSEELHGAELFNPRGKRNYPNPKLQHRSERMKIYHYFLERLSAALPDAKVLTVSI
ncbi:DUF3800 domain-containing protein [Thermosinus carboxydivorans]|uniref:DUF3800 domain-containing protein n=1 Tax=Thermosinus carboxydivorans TaxID=261685 RepID=UPI0018DC2ADE|nr:hypothetical protein [Thermosinus carboxydivorans]